MESLDTKTILLVEDEAIIALTQTKILEKHGYIVLTASSGQTAIDQVHKNKIDLILMDIDLGSGIDGTDTAQIILKKYNIPIIFLTSHSEKDYVEKVKKITKYGYVIKNSGEFVLLTSIDMAFELFASHNKIIESETKYKSIVENINDAFIIHDFKGKILDVNTNECTLLGYTYDEFKNMTLADINSEISVNLIENRMKTLLEEGKIIFENFDKHKDGSLIPVEVSAKVVSFKNNGIIQSFIRDISERKRHEEIINKQLQDLNSIFNGIPHPTIVMNPDHTILSANKALKIKLEKDNMPYEGRKCWEIFHSEDSSSPPEGCPFEQMLCSESIESADMIMEAFGGYYMVSCTPLFDINGKLEKVLHIATDITDRENMYNHIKSLLAEKDILLTEIHHRVKNNISNIEGLLSLQYNSTENVVIQAALQDAISRIQSMRILYEKLLISKDFQDVSIKSYIESIIDALFQVFPNSENIIFDRNIADFLINVRKAVPIGIIINELLTNIYKYAFINRPDSNRSIKVNILRTNNTVEITILDNGIGIDERIIENKSPGFGLTIVKMLVEQLKGTYSIVNENGTKSVIQFEL